MPTTPFSDILRPICEEFVEIGQPTFTELISVRQKTTCPAIGTGTPNTLIALKEVAFGRSCRGETQDPFTPGMLIASPSIVPVSAEPIVAEAAAEVAEAESVEIVSISKYSINNRNRSAKAYTDKVSSLGMAKSSVEFRKLVINDESIVHQSIFVDPATGCVRCDGSDNKLLAPGLHTQADASIWSSTGFQARMCGTVVSEFGGSFNLTNKSQCIVTLLPRYEGISEASQEIRGLPPGSKITFSVTIPAIRGATGTPIFVAIRDLSQVGGQQVVAAGLVIRNPVETEISQIVCISGIVPDQGAVIVSVERGPWFDPPEVDRPGGPFEVFINNTSLCVEPQFSDSELPTCRFGAELTFDDFTETSGRWTDGLGGSSVIINRCFGNCGYARITGPSGDSIATKFTSGTDFIGPGTFEVTFDVLAVVGTFTIWLVQGTSEGFSQRFLSITEPGRYFLSIAVDVDSPDIDVLFSNIGFRGGELFRRTDVVATVSNILTCFKSDATITCVSPIFQDSFSNLDDWIVGTGGNCSGSPPPEAVNAAHIADIVPESNFTANTGNRVHLRTQLLTGAGFSCQIPSKISANIVLPSSSLHSLLVEFRFSNNVNASNSFEFGFEDPDGNVIVSIILTDIDTGSLPNLKLRADEFEIDTQINPNVRLFFKIVDTTADFEVTISNVSVCLNTTVELCTGTLVRDAEFDIDTEGWNPFFCPDAGGTFASVTQLTNGLGTFLQVRRGDGSFLIPGVEKCPDDGPNRLATRADLTLDFTGFEEGYMLFFYAGATGQTTVGGGGGTGHTFEIVITDISDNVLARSGSIGGSLAFGDSIPAPLRIGFPIPSDGMIIANIEVRPNPALNNLTEYSYSFDRIIACGSVSATIFNCPPGFNKLDFDAFTVSVDEPEVRTAWTGGSDPQFDSDNQWMILFANRGTSGSQIQRIFSDLTAFSTIFLEFDTITTDTSDPAIPPTIQVSTSNGFENQRFDIEPGRVGIEIELGDSDVLLITIQNVGDVDGAVDNILVCERFGSPILNCLKNVTDISATIRWNGTPRAPINVFNALIRYTLRDINSLIRSDVTFLSTSEGRLGIESCDRWKQELVVLDTNILSKNLSLIETVNEGDIITVGDIGSGGDVFTSTHPLVTSIQQGAGESWESVVLDPLTGETSLKITLRPTPIVAATSGFVTQVSRELLHIFDFSGLPSGGVVTGIIFEVTYDTTSKLHGDNSETITESAQIVVDRLTTSASGVNGAYPGWLVRTNESNLKKFWGARTLAELGNLDPDEVGRAEEPIFTTPLTTDQLKATDGFGFSKFAIATRYGDVFTDKSIPPIPVLASGPPTNFETTVIIRDVTATVMFQAAPKPGRTNWLWSIPTTDVAGQDDLVINFPDPPEGQLIESVNILLLTNQMVPAIGKSSLPVNPAPLACTPDPAQEFDILINYTNSLKLLREFAVSVAKNTLWTQEADFTADLVPWDTVTASEHGIKGETARWEQIEFLLDAVDGRGLDQCSIPVTFVVEGTSEFNFKKFEINSTSVSNDACDAEIIIEDLSMGAVSNEIQSIVLPATSGGTWDLSFTNIGITETTTLPWNTTAAQIRVRLGAFTNIGGTNNVNVTGLGTLSSPFLVEFIDNLAAKDLQLLVANGNNLTGASSAFISTENDGTANERQRISNPTDDRQNLTISFAGNTSVPIPYNSSLNVVQSALEGIIGIGIGNIFVTGDITDRDAAYTGPYIVDFIGTLANSNVSQMIASPTTYIVTTDWNGGSAGGQNEKQLINVNAFGGTYTLRVFNLGSGPTPVIEVDTVQDGELRADCYDITFGGTLLGTNIATNSFFSPTTAFVHTQQNITPGSAGTIPVAEVQRHSFDWTTINGIIASNSQFGLTAPSDSIFVDLLNTIAASLLQRGISSSNAIKTYLESAAAVTAGDITVSEGFIRDAATPPLPKLVTTRQVEDFPTTEPNAVWQNVSAVNTTGINQLSSIADMASIGTELSDAWQRFQNFATTGTYTLSFGGQTTAALVWNLSAAGIQSALEGLSTIGAGNIEVVGGPGTIGNSERRFYIHFIGTLAEQAVSTITFTNSTNGTLNIANFNTGGATSRDEIVIVNLDRQAAGLTWRLEFGGTFSSNLTTGGVDGDTAIYTADFRAAVLAVLQASDPTITTSDFLIEVISGGGLYIIKFINNLAALNLGPFTIDTINLNTTTQFPAVAGSDGGGLAPGETTDWLEVLGFTEFDIPDGAIISGIQLDTNTKHIHDDDALLFTFQLMKGGVRVGTQDSIDDVPGGFPPLPPEPWRLGLGVGGDGNLFGETWTKDDFTASDFGLAIRVTNTGTKSTQFGIVNLSVIVRYTAPFSPKDEIQTVALKNGPTGGTFTLTVEGETTIPIPFDASAAIVQNALRALSNLSTIVVAETGILPADVTYTIFFQDADGSRNWQEIVADASGLTSDTEFADTAPIAFNAAPSAVESALVAAASFITTADISVTQVTADVDDGLYIWRTEFTGVFERQDVTQMQANAAALNGAPVVIIKIQDGGGTNDRQRVTIFNATSGSFRLLVTINDIEYTTAPIPWDTTAAGMESQLLALAPFDIADLTVTELPKSEANQQLKVTVTFKKKFGNIPLMIADFETTLFCNPAFLEFVPAGPYQYPLPECCDIEDQIASACRTDLSCQSGPLLCKPCEGDEQPEPEPPCCDADNIPISVNCSTRLHFERDLFDPSSMTTPGCLPLLPCTRNPNVPLPAGRRFTIRDLAVVKGLDPSDYVPYFRNFKTQQFTAASYSTPINTKMNIILIENELDTNRGHERIADHLRGHREILPARFVWPDCDTTILGSEECWPGIGN